MKYRFTIKRILLAVLVFALPFALLQGYGNGGAILACVIGASAAAASLLGRPRELRNTLLTILALIAYVVLFMLGGVLLSADVDSAEIKPFATLIRFFAGGTLLVLILRRFLPSVRS